MGLSTAIGLKGFIKAGGSTATCFLAGGVGVLGLCHTLLRGRGGGGGGGGTVTGGRGIIKTGGAGDGIDGRKTGRFAGGGGGGGGDVGITVALCCTELPFLIGDSIF